MEAFKVTGSELTYQITEAPCQSTIHDMRVGRLLLWHPEQLLSRAHMLSQVFSSNIHEGYGVSSLLLASCLCQSIPLSSTISVME